MVFAFVILSTAVMLSVVAAYYSIAGLTAIFSAAVIPVIIMGATMELGKVVATVWLHNNWKRINFAFKAYLVPAVIFLMILTSMGIFGFLSKAHSDQSLVSGDAMSKVAIFDEKIATERENIAQAKKALEQMNAQVDQMLGRSETERGAERAVSIRKNQAKERAALQAEITKSQKEIQRLQEERAPLAAEFRKIEAEVGPIKYIAALLYGDNPDQNILERAVRWVIILIVVVFDPLALCLILAGNKQIEWVRAGKGSWMHDDTKKEPIEEETSTPEEFFERSRLMAQALDIRDEKERAAKANKEMSNIDREEKLVEIVLPEIDYGKCPKCSTELLNATGIGLFCPNKECDVVDGIEEGVAVIEGNTEVVETTVASVEPENVESKVDNTPPFEGVKDENGNWVQTGPSFVTKSENLPYKKSEGDYVEYQGKSMHIDVLRSFNPELFLQEDNERASSTNFGTEFPNNPRTGDTFVRVDATPNRIFKFNGVRWIEVNRGITETHLTNEYMQFLVDKIATGEYDLDMLTDNEQVAIEKFIQNQNA